MRIIKLKNLSKEQKRKIIKRSAGLYAEVSERVKPIMEDIRLNGDKAVKKYTKMFDGVDLQSLQVTQKEIEEAYSQVNKKFLEAIKQAIKNVFSVHKVQLKKERKVSPQKGITVWREWRAIEKVGIYIPGGKAIYPSSVIMNVVPAKIAGCKEIVVCIPPKRDGKIPAPTLSVCDLLEISKIFKIGGAQAIAAMVYGTETVPVVYKIFGAGGIYVTAAKMIVFGKVNIDLPAGPSEVFIIADESANPAFVAADLLADAEHGEDSAAILLTNSEQLARSVAREINKQSRKLPTANRIRKALEKYGLLAVVKNLDEAVTFCNEYAPEHLELMTKNNQDVLKKIKNVGSVFLGPYTCKSSGDYATGANHILPTGGAAKMFAPLSVESFGRYIQIQKVSKTGLKVIRGSVETLAEIEGLPAHKYSCQVRFQ